jgi:hypothetical protein
MFLQVRTQREGNQVAAATNNGQDNGIGRINRMDRRDTCRMAPRQLLNTFIQSILKILLSCLSAISLNDRSWGGVWRVAEFFMGGKIKNSRVAGRVTEPCIHAY